MAVELAEYDAGVKVFTWDTSLVEGETCELWADNPADETPLAFKKNLVNDGEGHVAFPDGFTGECSLEVRGANDSKDEGTIVVA